MGTIPKIYVGKGGFAGGKGEWADRESKGKKISLDERNYRRVEKFDGDVQKYRGCRFDLLVGIGQVDDRLGREIKRMLGKVGDVKGVISDHWDPVGDGGMPKDLHEKYQGELYGILCSLTGCEAKNILKGMQEASDGMDGFKGIMFLEKRFDARTSASLLQAYLGVVTPGVLKSSDLVSGIHKWELKVGNLFSRYGETLGDKLKLAMLVGMIPKEFQDLVLQNGMSVECADYAKQRDFILGIASSRAQMARPVPMELGAVGREGEEEGEYWEESEVYAVGQEGGSCFKCGGSGHYSRECPTKGKGKGKGVGNKGTGKGGKGGTCFNCGIEGHFARECPKKGKGKGKGEKGKGKGGGYQGTCFNCGKVGHKAAESRSTTKVGAVEEGEEGEQCMVELGGVWMLGAVEARGYETKNSFEPLGEEESVCGTCGKIGYEEELLEIQVCGKREVEKKKKKKKDKRDSERDTWIQPVEQTEKGKLGFRFQVADVKKPLVSVKRITEKGNHVQFGPGEKDNFILNKESGDKVLLRRNGKGSYMLDVCFVGGEKTSITVDSGAEENVCPWEWGEQFIVLEACARMQFRNASGGAIEHFGQRDVVVESPF